MTRFVIKLGGSIITNKNEPLSIDVPTLLQISEEVAAALRETDLSLAIVHGGGSYGHPSVRECLERRGVIDKPCYVRTTYLMSELSLVVTQTLISAGVPAVDLSTRSICTIEQNLPECELDIAIKLIDRGIVPVLFGDGVLSNEGYEVLSGDDIVWLLARAMGNAEVVFVTDVDGIYDRDPRKYPNANLVREITASKALGFAEESCKTDVTGGMRGKLVKGLKYAKGWGKAYVVNGGRRWNLFNLLTGKPFIGTVIWYH
jgi:isopentenyl phosphate kinase